MTSWQRGLQRGEKWKRGKQTKAGRELTARHQATKGHKRDRKHQDREGVREAEKKGPATGSSRGSKGPGPAQEGQSAGMRAPPIPPPSLTSVHLRALLPTEKSPFSHSRVNLIFNQ